MTRSPLSDSEARATTDETWAPSDDGLDTSRVIAPLRSPSSAMSIEQFPRLLESVLGSRPEPLRRYDQIHMVVEDLAAHILDIAPGFEGKQVLFMGDSDGLVVGVALAAHFGLVPRPRQLLLCDFDERVLHFTSQALRAIGEDQLARCQLYNVFSPLPVGLREYADAFHTNPPYGRYNRGRSVVAFVERCIAATKPGGNGTIVLANDQRYPWSLDVLREVLHALMATKVTPVEIAAERHHYHLDDEPELTSGLIRCVGVQPEYAISPAHPLPESFRRHFYGRRTIPIPERIPLDADARQLALSV